MSSAAIFVWRLKYSQLALSRSRRDPLKHIEISVLWYIRFAELRKIQIEQPNFTNKYVIWLFKLEMYTENTVEKGRNCSLGAISPLIHIFYNLLDLNVKRRTRFSLRDKRLFEISEVEITSVDCSWICKRWRIFWGGPRISCLIWVSIVCPLVSLNSP